MNPSSKFLNSIICHYTTILFCPVQYSYFIKLIFGKKITDISTHIYKVQPLTKILKIFLILKIYRQFGS